MTGWEEFELPVEIDYVRPFPGCQVEDWEQEYLACVHPEVQVRTTSRSMILDHTSHFYGDFATDELDPCLKDFLPSDQTRGDES